MLQKFFKDQRAASGPLSFLAIFLILMVILVQFVEPVNLAFSDIMLTLAYKKGLDGMQQSGGLTAEIESNIKGFLMIYGFDKEKISVRGTIAPVNWGEDISLEIGYEKEYKKYKIKAITGIQSEVQIARSLIEGSTTSYYFDND